MVKKTKKRLNTTRKFNNKTGGNPSGSTMTLSTSKPRTHKSRKQSKPLIRLGDIRSGRKVGFYGGCMCPLHKGHLNIIENLSKTFDVLYIGIHKGTRRHGWDFQNTKKWLDIFITKIQANVITIISDGGYPQLAAINQGIYEPNRGDQCIIVYGADYKIERGGQKHEAMQGFIVDYNNNLLYQQKNIKFSDYIVPRSDDDVSATKFAKKITEINEQYLHPLFTIEEKIELFGDLIRAPLH